MVNGNDWNTWLLYDKTCPEAWSRIKLQGQWKEFKAAKEKYADEGKCAGEAFVLAANDFPPREPVEQPNNTDLNEDEFWKGISAAWRKSRDYADMDGFWKASQMLAKKMEYKRRGKEEKSPEELAQEALREAERLGG